jgi:hypothetical protein
MARKYAWIIRLSAIVLFNQVISFDCLALWCGIGIK